jgi:hypothetical protein
MPAASALRAWCQGAGQSLQLGSRERLGQENLRPTRDAGHRRVCDEGYPMVIIFMIVPFCVDEMETNDTEKHSDAAPKGFGIARK